MHIAFITKHCPSETPFLVIGGIYSNSRIYLFNLSNYLQDLVPNNILKFTNNILKFTENILQ